MIPISVVVITFNEERNIGRCLDSVRDIADEIIVLDSFSTDRTVEIAKEKGARVFQKPFRGYVEQKNNAMEYASHRFVLSLDADEALSDRLKFSILEERKNFSFAAYRMKRAAFYCGKFIKWGTWYPERKIRLFDKTAVQWGGLDPHDKIIHSSDLRIGILQGDILHYICDTIEEHKQRVENFSTIAARSLYQRGEKTSWLKIITSPTWFFLFDYLIRGGFISGWRGWKIATLQARYHYLKYFKLLKMIRDGQNTA